MRALITTLLLLSAATAGAQADHLQCFKIRDSVTRTTYGATLTPADNTFPVAAGCVVRMPAKLLCVGVVKTITDGNPPGAGPGQPAQKYLCYKVKCPKATPIATIQDQFGLHQVTVKGTSLLCAPEATPTTTTVASSTTTTTGCPNVDADRDGYFAPPCGNDCDDLNAEVNSGHAEVCNGIDDNCNSISDEGLGTLSCGVGACQNTVPSCLNGQPNACTPGTPSPETCNGADDDCDGSVDEGLGSTTCGTGACQNTVPNCVGGQPQTCTPLLGGPEACGNTVDDDCDGLVDEQPCQCTTNGQCPAAPNATGLCQAGACTIQCNDGFADCNASNADGCEVDTTSSLQNCGACGSVCSFPNASAGCLNGYCFLIQCNPAYGNCDFDTANGCETPVWNDPANCGACSFVCPPETPTCFVGGCQ